MAPLLFRLPNGHGAQLRAARGRESYIRRAAGESTPDRPPAGWRAWQVDWRRRVSCSAVLGSALPKRPCQKVENPPLVLDRAKVMEVYVGCPGKNPECLGLGRSLEQAF